MAGSPSIEQIVAQIRTALFGKDVRENIALGIEKCYDDTEDKANKSDVTNNYGVPSDINSCNDVTYNSTYFVSASGSGPTIPDWPYGVLPGWLITVANEPQAVQFAVCWSVNRIKSRERNHGTWKTWGEYMANNEPSQMDPLGSCNLNSIVNVNNSYLLTDSNTYTNMPIGSERIGMLVVTHTANWTMQCLYSLSGDGVWNRLLSNGGQTIYRDWVKLNTNNSEETTNRIIYNHLSGSIPIKWSNMPYTSNFQGVVVTVNEEVLHVEGTANTSKQTHNMFVENHALPSGMEKGNTYIFSLTIPNRVRTGDDFSIAVYFNRTQSGSANWELNKLVRPNEDVLIDIPNDISGLLLRYELSVTGNTLNDDVYFSITKIPNIQYLSRHALLSDDFLKSCDLNSLVLQNHFYLLADSQAYTHVPDDERVGFLQVLSSNNWTLQIFYYFFGGKMWTRRASGNPGQWSEWVMISGGEIKNITNEYNTNHYTNTYNITASPIITTDTNNYLSSPGDTTDMTSAIQTILSSNKVCNLGPGTFYVTGVDVPDYSLLRGSGPSTIIRLADSVDDGYAIRLNKYGSVSDLQLAGYSSGGITPSSTVRTRHAILFEGNYDGDRDQLPQRCQLSNLLIWGFAGGGITCVNTGYDYDKSLNAVNCYIWNCDAGINISYWSEFNRFTNISVHGCYYGCINNGGNNTFTSCDFSGNRGIGVLMDNTDNKSPNNTHGSMVGCVINHTNSNTGIGIKIINCQNGFIFTGCQLFYSQIYIEDSNGINISDTNFGYSNCDITVIGGGLILFSNNIHQSLAPILISNNIHTHFINCYRRDTGAEIIP